MMILITIGHFVSKANFDKIAVHSTWNNLSNYSDPKIPPGGKRGFVLRDRPWRLLDPRLVRAGVRVRGAFTKLKFEIL